MNNYKTRSENMNNDKPESKPEERAGKITLERIVLWVVALFVIFYVLNWLVPYDTTDNIAYSERSGMALYTDNLTGCQYLKAGSFGGITPRVDKNGTHVGCR